MIKQWTVNFDLRETIQYELRIVVTTGHESRPSDFLLKCALENNRRDRLLGLPRKKVPNDMSVCFDRADSFELGHFDQYFHLIIWLEVKKRYSLLSRCFRLWKI